jgi:predicted small lipoprotein YifL
MTAVTSRAIGYYPSPDRETRPASGGGDVVPGDRSNIYRIALAGALIAALSLSACGRKGALEAPLRADVTSGADDAAASGEEEKAKKPDRKFFLDPLI